MPALLLRIALLTWIAACALAQDWPQFLGPARNGVYSGNDLAASWPPAGPAVIWKKEVGQGFSSPVVAEGRLILFHRIGQRSGGGARRGHRARHLVVRLSHPVSGRLWL